MNVIEALRCKKFKGAWVAFETLQESNRRLQSPTQSGKAIDYACQRFGGSAGEVHIYGERRFNIRAQHRH